MATDIALRIGGTKYRQKGGGYNPVLVNCGVFADNNVKLDSLPTVTETPSFKLIKTSGYTLYVLNDTKIHSADASTPGFLNVAVTILSNKQLKDDKSPYELLMDVYQKFMDLYTTPESDGFKRFKDTEYDKNIFSELLQKYPLEDTKKKNVTMNPQGGPATLCVPQNKMSEFFADPQYDEFADFREIEIGSMCQTTQGLDKLIIPRPIIYKVFVDNNPKGNMPNMPFYYTKPATQDVTYPQIKFTLEDLKHTSTINQNGAIIKLSRSQERIDVDTSALKGEDVKCQVSVKVNGDLRYKEYAITDFKNGYNKLTLGGYDLKEVIVSGAPIEIPLKKVRNAELALQCNNEFYEIPSPTKLMLQQKIQITLNVVKKTQKIATVVQKVSEPIITKKIEAQKVYNSSEQKHSKKKFNLKELCFGLLFGLIVGGVIGWLVPNSQENNTSTTEFTADKAKEQLVEYAQLEKNPLRFRDKALNLLSYDSLLTFITSEEEKEAVKRFFDPENNIKPGDKKVIDTAKVKEIKNKTIKNWNDLLSTGKELNNAVKDMPITYDYNSESDFLAYLVSPNFSQDELKKFKTYKSSFNAKCVDMVISMSEYEFESMQKLCTRAQDIACDDLIPQINNIIKNYDNLPNNAYTTLMKNNPNDNKVLTDSRKDCIKNILLKHSTAQDHKKWKEIIESYGQFANWNEVLSAAQGNMKKSNLK